MPQHERRQSLGAAGVARHLIDHFAALEQEQRGDGADLIGQRRARVLVDIEFHDPQLTFEGRRKGAQVRDEGPTRTRPNSPEIDENQRLGVQDVLLEVCVGDAWKVRHEVGGGSENEPKTAGLASSLFQMTNWTRVEWSTRLSSTSDCDFMPRIYLSQELVDECMAVGRMELDGDFLRVGAAVALCIEPAVFFETVDGGAVDAHGVIGCVKSSGELAEMGAEHYDRSVVVGDVAYTVRPGFLGIPVGADGVPSTLDNRQWSHVATILGELAAA